VTVPITGTISPGIKKGFPVRLSEQAYHLIKEKIIRLEMAPLSVVDEQVLREELGLGRTPIREALHRLSAEGLVTIAPRRGMFVAEISITDLSKIFEVRMTLEGFCARLAAQRITQDQIAQMEMTLMDLDAISEGDAETLMRIDERFHSLLYQAADNEFLMDTLDRLHALSMRLWYLVLNHIADVQGAIQQHRKITAALKAGDGKKAEELVCEHIAEFQQKIKAAL
jgi:DNA-binding GntR family transcriptional regulator